MPRGIWAGAFVSDLHSVQEEWPSATSSRYLLKSEVQSFSYSNLSTHYYSIRFGPRQVTIIKNTSLFVITVFVILGISPVLPTGLQDPSHNTD